jgi:protein-S-isoprenylcysteine O-methyltransferase Ste14
MAVAKWPFRLRGLLVAPPMFFAFICYYGETEGHFVWPLGIGLLLIGVMIRIWAQQHLHFRLIAPRTLTATGPFSLVRNPIYIGNILMCLGGIVVSELLWFVPFTLLYLFGLYSLVVRYEEDHLLMQYGEPYRRYMATVPRWFPRAFHFKNLGLRNEYLRQSIVVEMHSLSLLLPYILKEIIEQ